MQFLWIFAHVICNGGKTKAHFREVVYNKAQVAQGRSLMTNEKDKMAGYNFRPQLRFCRTRDRGIFESEAESMKRNLGYTHGSSQLDKCSMIYKCYLL